MTEKRSTFVTVLAWILIIFTGFGVFVNILQNIMVNTVFTDEDFINSPTTENEFNFFDLIFTNFRLAVAVFGVLFLIVFISSIALLKRKNWSRIVLSIFFSLAILYTIGMTIFVWEGFANLAAPRQNVNIGTFQKIIISIIGIFLIGLITLYSWIIYKLNSKKIKSEFK